jgi:hypothetical protein
MLSSREKKWEAYIGMSQNEVLAVFENVLQKQQIPYQIMKAPPIFMYDAKHEQILIQAGEIVFSLIYVTADPLTRMFSTILGTSKKFGGITLLSIKTNKGSTQTVTTILKEFVHYSPKEPWRIRSHPRFQFAVLLQLLNKWKWEKYQSN